MISPGTYTLAALSLTAPLAAVAQSATTGLDGIEAATLECRFGYGSGGATASVTAQVSFDGTNWIDVARFDFTTASAAKVANLNGMLSKAVTAYNSLGAEGVLDGVLAGIWRALVTTTGVYSNTTLSLRIAAR
jgi:hypothetical protein